MFIELIPQRKLHGGGQMGGRVGIFFFLLQKIDFFFFSEFVGWKKNLQNNFSAGKQLNFLLCCSSKEEFTPC